MALSPELEAEADAAVGELLDHATRLAQEDKRQAFSRLDEGRYRFHRPGIEIEVDGMRRVSGALKGEVIVRTNLRGADTNDGVLSAEDLNLSSSRARSSFGKHLAERSKVSDFDWIGLVEDFCVRVLAAEKSGEPSVILSDVPKPKPDSGLAVGDLKLLSRQATIIFGDGGTAKSYLALYVAGRLAQDGATVAFFDWELDAPDHRDRLERLFGLPMPRIHYARCSRALVYEADRLRRIVREQKIEFAVFDSIAFACDGPPESAEVAGRYFQALRQLGTIGSVHLAHVTKALEGADQRPFGSTFWHNGARATWNVKLDDSDTDQGIVKLALHNRKANLGPRQRSIGFELEFGTERTFIDPINPGNVPELAVGLTLQERLIGCLQAGPKSRDWIAAALDDVKEDSLRKTINRARKKGTVIEFQDGKIALQERRR